MFLRGERQKGELSCMNLNAMARKLQSALVHKGIHVSINQYQHYSDKAERMVTKFVITRPMYVEAEEKIKNVTICESYQMIDVVKKLAGLLGDDGGGQVC